MLKGRFGEGTIEIATSRGNLQIPAKDIVNIMRAKAASGASGSGSSLPGKGTLTGRVLDNFGKPVGGARVQILGSSLQSRTDSDGRYRLNYVPGQLQIGIEASGHDPIQFALAPSAPAEYPVEDKVLLRFPPGTGMFLADSGDWTALQQCRLKQTRRIGGDIDLAGVRKETFRVTGSPLRIAGRSTLAFLDNSGSTGELFVYRVDDNDEIVTDTQSGGLAGVMELAAPWAEKKTGATSRVAHSKQQRFPGRNFLTADFGPGLYAIADVPDNCFEFQVGPDQPLSRQTVTETPTEYKSFSVEGKSIKFWSTPDANRTAFFQTESKGYRNTYKIDCVGKRFLWTENARLSTGETIGNSAGAEWKPLNPNSTIANAVCDAACR